MGCSPSKHKSQQNLSEVSIATPPTPIPPLSSGHPVSSVTNSHPEAITKERNSSVKEVRSETKTETKQKKQSQSDKDDSTKNVTKTDSSSHQETTEEKPEKQSEEHLTLKDQADHILITIDYPSSQTDNSVEHPATAEKKPGHPSTIEKNYKEIPAKEDNSSNQLENSSDKMSAIAEDQNASSSNKSTAVAKEKNISSSDKSIVVAKEKNISTSEKCTVVAKDKTASSDKSTVVAKDKTVSSSDKSTVVAKDKTISSSDKSTAVAKEQNISSSDKSTVTAKEPNISTSNKTSAIAKEETVCQKQFDHIIRTANCLVKPEFAEKVSVPDVTKLKLNQALPSTCPITNLLHSLNNIQVLNLSGNNFGPQAFRAVCLAMCSNTTVVFLNLAANKTDTDSAECVGKMLSSNKTLRYLDVSNNSLGNDFFSRCVGPALTKNTSLKTLRAKSIGSVDMKILSAALSENISLTDLDLSSNGLSDKTALARGLASSLENSGCVLSSLCVSQCNMNETGLEELCLGIRKNSSLTELNISANQLGSLKLVAQFLAAVFNHPKMTAFYLNDAKISNICIVSHDVPECSTNLSCLQVLGLNSSRVNGDLLQALTEQFKGKLLSLKDVDIGNNPELSSSVMDDLWKLTAGELGHSSIERLTYEMNHTDGLSSDVTVAKFPHLKYLNLRKAKLSRFCQLSDFLSFPDLDTVNLDGLKMAGTDGLKTICASLPTSHVTAISIGSCSLADSDLVPLCDVIKTGAQLHMLKLSANRITDVLMSHLVDALLKHKKHPLSVLDVSNNLIESEGARSLAKLYTTKGHHSCLCSLNISGNSVGKEGLLALVAVVGKKSPLTTLYLNDQKKCLQENEMDEIFKVLAASINLTIKQTGETIESACSDLPSISDDFFIKLTGLGGDPGMLGSMMHCPAIVTDKSTNQLLSVSLDDVLNISAILKGLDSVECVLSADEWDAITGAKKDREVPSWLQLADHRCRAIYASNLCGNVSLTKLDTLFEMDANCNIEEVVLMKDPVTRANNGVGWILMKDLQSVDRAIDFYRRGEAKIFGQTFMVSRVNVKVDDHKSQELEAKVRTEAEARLKARQAEDSAHRDLIHRNTEESWKRHAYRLAHPAYADGRIW